MWNFPFRNMDLRTFSTDFYIVLDCIKIWKNVYIFVKVLTMSFYYYKNLIVLNLFFYRFKFIDQNSLSKNQLDL